MMRSSRSNMNQVHPRRKKKRNKYSLINRDTMIKDINKLDNTKIRETNQDNNTMNQGINMITKEEVDIQEEAVDINREVEAEVNKIEIESVIKALLSNNTLK